MKIDVVIAPEIEIPIDPQNTGARAEVLLLLLVAKHQKGRVGGDIGADPAVRAFGGRYGAERSDGARQTVDLTVGHAGQLDNERCRTCSLVPSQEFGPAKFNLAREKRDSEDCRGERQGSQ